MRPGLISLQNTSVRPIATRAVTVAERVGETPAVDRAAVSLVPGRTADDDRDGRADRPEDRPDRPERPDLGDTLADATRIDLPFRTVQSVGGADDPGDFAGFTIEREGDVFIGLAARDGNPDLTLYDANNTAIRKLQTGEDDHAALIMPVGPGETFKVGIESSGDGPVYYAARLRFNPDAGDSIADATEIEGRKFAVAASVGRPNDPGDFYAYVAPEDGKISLRVDGFGGNPDPNVVVMDREGVILGTGAADAEGHVRLSFAVEEGQTYIIGLSSPTGDVVTYDLGMSYQTTPEVAANPTVADIYAAQQI